MDIDVHPSFPALADWLRTELSEAEEETKRALETLYLDAQREEA